MWRLLLTYILRHMPALHIKWFHLVLPRPLPQFMHDMNDVLARYLDIFIFIFLDDIFLCSYIVEKHVEHLWTVFAILGKHRLFTKGLKCNIIVKKVEFLGQWIMPQGGSPLKEKAWAIRYWVRPQMLENVRSFQGFANCYSSFIPKIYGGSNPINIVDQ